MSVSKIFPSVLPKLAKTKKNKNKTEMQITNTRSCFTATFEQYNMT